MLLSLPKKIIATIILDLKFYTKKGVTQYYRSQYSKYRRQFYIYLFGGATLMLFSVFGSAVYLATVLPLGFDAISFITNTFSSQNILTLGNAFMVGGVSAIVLETVTFGSGASFLQELKRNKRFKDALKITAYFVVFLISAGVEVFTFNQSVKLIYKSVTFDKSLKILKAQHAKEFKDKKEQYNILFDKYKEAQKGKVNPRDLVVSTPSTTLVAKAKDKIAFTQDRLNKAKELYSKKYGNLDSKKYRTLKTRKFALIVKPKLLEYNNALDNYNNLMSSKRVLTLDEYKNRLQQYLKTVEKDLKDKQKEISEIKKRINIELERVNNNYNNKAGIIAGLILLLFQIYVSILREENENDMLRIYDNAGKQIARERKKESLKDDELDEIESFLGYKKDENDLSVPSENLEKFDEKSDENSLENLEKDIENFLKEKNNNFDDLSDLSDLSDPSQEKNSSKSPATGAVPSDLSRNDPSDLSKNDLNDPSDLSRNDPSDLSRNDPSDLSKNDLSVPNDPSDLSRNDPSVPSSIVDFFIENNTLPSTKQLQEILELSERQAKKFRADLKTKGYIKNTSRTTVVPTEKFLDVVIAVKGNKNEKDNEDV